MPPHQDDFWSESIARQGDTSQRTPLETPAQRSELPSTCPPEHSHVPTDEAGALAPGTARGYEILEELGHGGMGIVYRARDLLLKRVVALKRIKSGALNGPEVDRFYREAEAAARLRHPNIVPIYAIDQLDGSPCYTMPLITGGTLTHARDRCLANPREAVALLEKVARAVHAAHGAGVIHRDLKPGNILLDEEGEPLVADFGLAKIVDAEGAVTISHGAIGTPAYMAPEQVAGLAEQVSPATDIWALGVILYEMVTGQRPFGGLSYELGSKIVRTEPPPPRVVRPQLHRDLETIVMKCLEKEPARRYPSAQALADDLGRFLHDEPILQRRRPWLRRARYALARAWPRWSIALPVLAVVLLVLGGIAWSMRSPAPPRQEPVRDPQAEAKEILDGLYRQIDAGSPTTLIDGTGQECWHRWVTPNDLPPLRRVVQGYRSIPAVEMTLLELLPDPRWNRWVLSADVLYLQHPHLGRAGLYVMGEETATPLGPVHQFVSFTLVADKEKDGFVRMAPQRHRKPHPKAGEFVVKDATGGLKLPLTAFAEWHTLAIEMSKDEIEASFDKKRVQKIKRSRLDLTLELQDRNPAIQKLLLPRSPFKVRGSLGLCVSGGRALFRNVILKPLPQP
jgi:hypothetical protein